ncbi:hypothetical protein BaRGS_00030574 [Batillaria attramentaria]|uniref:Uncharacterized protein n=1 Tax=Batillaria attramentaria TaxID=370345 RepID=A0ABD0JUJ8_9CAEN
MSCSNQSGPFTSTNTSKCHFPSTYTCTNRTKILKIDFTQLSMCDEIMRGWERASICETCVPFPSGIPQIGFFDTGAVIPTVKASTVTVHVHLVSPSDPQLLRFALDRVFDPFPISRLRAAKRAKDCRRQQNHKYRAVKVVGHLHSAL